MSILNGLKIVEFEGLGPGPFCGMLFADLGADVVVIEREGALAAGSAAIFRRGKRSIALDLKKAGHLRAAAAITANSDALIEGFRPGVMERLGLGPSVLQAMNPRLVYGRLTGWGQHGPLADAAGHDLNYASLVGASWYSGAPGGDPAPPPTLVGDVGGGALYLAVGILSGVISARETGKGSVIDAAIVDGAAHMMNLLLSLRATGGLPDERGRSMLDGAHFYGVYACRDGGRISIGPLEPKFYTLLLERLGLADDASLAEQFDVAAWPALRETLARHFATRTRDEWSALLEGTDVCYAPVLSPGEAAAHPHLVARGVYREIGGVLQTAAAPRFDGVTPADPSPPPVTGAHTDEILAGIGLSRADLG